MYYVALDEFEGPLDLLLFFIKRDELDIYDIPISEITDEYLRYVRVLERIDLDGAGEFIYMAAVLMNIKAQMLLPDPEEDEDGEEVDPRRALVERLLEYMRHKEAAQNLDDRYRERAEHFTRGTASDEEDRYERSPKEIEYRVSVFDLVSVLTELVQEAPADEPVHEVTSYDYSVEGQQEYLLEQLAQGEDSVSFVNLVRHKPKAFIIATFLAVLELAKDGRIRVGIRVERDDFFIERQMEEDKAAADAEGA